MGASSTAVMPGTLRRSARGGRDRTADSLLHRPSAWSRDVPDNCCNGALRRVRMPRAFSGERRSPHSVGRRRTRSGGGRVRHRRPGRARPGVRTRDAARRDPSVVVGTGLGSLRGRARLWPARASGPGSSASSCPTPRATDPKDARFRATGVAGQSRSSTRCSSRTCSPNACCASSCTPRSSKAPPRRRRSSRRSCSRDALAPTNFLPTNPVALVRAFETAGGSLVGGARNFLHDVVENHGWPSQVDRSAFGWARTSRPHRARSCSATS